MRISDWSSDVCSSDLLALLVAGQCDQRSDSLCLRLGVSRCESLISRQQAGAWLFGNLKFRAAKRGDGSRVIASFGALGNGDPFVKIRSEERRVGKECVSTCRSCWPPYH